MAKATSARGEEVDFDLLKIKQKLGNVPTTPMVENRQSFIDNRLKRRLRSAHRAMTGQPDEPMDPKADKDDQEKVDE